MEIWCTLSEMGSTKVVKKYFCTFDCLMTCHVAYSLCKLAANE